MDNSRFRFRVWDRHIKDWLGAELFYIGTNGTLYIASEIHRAIIPYSGEDGFVIQQCTALKDRNGTLIYEGDIVKGYGEHRSALKPFPSHEDWCCPIGAVLWLDDQWFISTLGIKQDDKQYERYIPDGYCWSLDFRSNYWHDLEIIGNFFEDEDLLENDNG